LSRQWSLLKRAATSTAMAKRRLKGSRRRARARSAKSVIEPRTRDGHVGRLRAAGRKSRNPGAQSTEQGTGEWRQGQHGIAPQTSTAAEPSDAPAALSFAGEGGLALLLTPPGRAGREAREIEGHGGVHQLASLDVARPGLDWIASYRATPPLQLVGIVGEGQCKGRLRPTPSGGVVVQAARHRHVAVLVVGRISVPHPLLNAPPLLVSPDLVQARSRGPRRNRLPSGLDLDENL